MLIFFSPDLLSTHVYRTRSIFFFKDACNIVGDRLSDIYKLQALDHKMC